MLMLGHALEVHSASVTCAFADVSLAHRNLLISLTLIPSAVSIFSKYGLVFITVLALIFSVPAQV